MILSFFEGHEVKDVGGTDRCCDNCSHRRAQIAARGAGISIDDDITMTDKPQNYTDQLHMLLGAINVRSDSIVMFSVGGQL